MPGIKSITRSSRVNGFTLIELLVVVAVIAVLLAVLLPCIHRAKMTAKRLVCQGHLRQIAQAWHLYLEDYDGRFLQFKNANILYGGWFGRRDPTPRLLNPYVGLSAEDVNEEEAKIFFCPADRGGIPGPAAVEGYKAYSWNGTSYQTNLMLIGGDQIDTRVPYEAIQKLHNAVNQRLKKINMSRVSSPARLLLIGDCGWINQWRSSPHPRLDWKEMAEWHQRVDGFNLAFLDGHVKFLTIKKGLYIGDEYTILPFKDLFSMARTAQATIP